MADMHPVLNPSQRAHLSVVAAGIEETIVEIEHLLDPDIDRRSLLTRFDDDLPTGFAERARVILDDIRTDVAAFAEAFSLEGRAFSRAGSVMAHCSAQIVRIEESGGRHLRGYGAVAPGLDAVLAPHLESFRAKFAAIRFLLHDQGSAEDPYGSA
jgi:hypothetical protein